MAAAQAPPRAPSDVAIRVIVRGGRPTFHLPRADRGTARASLDMLAIGDTKLGIEIVPPKSALALAPHVAVKVLAGSIEWTEGGRRMVTCYPRVRGTERHLIGAGCATAPCYRHSDHSQA